MLSVGEFLSYVMSPSETNQPEPAGQPPAACEKPETPRVAIEKLVYGGFGLGRLEGRVVLVPFVLPGETVCVAIERERPGLLEARLLQIAAPAAGRAEPPCPFFFRCGGCQYQHAGYELQLEAKRTILAETLRRVGKLEPPEAIRTVSGPPWQYRNRTQFHIEGGRIGYFEFGSHRLIPVDRCPISSPKINDTLRALIEMLRDPRFPRFVRSLEVFTNETEVLLNVVETESGRGVSRRFFDWCAERLPGFAEALEYQAAGEAYRVSRRSFFQVNRFLADHLVRCALEGAEGESALDLYAGVGLFTVPLARRFAVTAVESNAAAARDLEHNARRAGTALQIEHNSVEMFLFPLERTPDFILADPPRSGLGKRVVRELLRLRPPRLNIVSCDPATLARDLAPLVSGGYRIDGLTLIDLFPQTFHIEAVARLRLA